MVCFLIERRLFKIIDSLSFRQSRFSDDTAEYSLSNCDFKKIVTELFAVTDMTDVTSAVLFRFENKSSGFHANECP